MKTLRNKKNLLGLITLFVLIAGLVTSLTLIGKKQDIRNRAQGTGQVIVKLDPANVTIAKGATQNFQVKVKNTTSANIQINTAGVEIQFPVENLQVYSSDVLCNTSSGFFTSAIFSRADGNLIKLTCMKTDARITISPGAEISLGSFIAGLKTTASGTSNLSVIRTNVPDATTSQDLSDPGTGSIINISSSGTPVPTGIPVSATPVVSGCRCQSSSCTADCSTYGTYVSGLGFKCGENSHCTRPKRNVGDSDGSEDGGTSVACSSANCVNLLDYGNYRKKMYLGALPSFVNTDFDGDGLTSADEDGYIIMHALGLR